MQLVPRSAAGPVAASLSTPHKAACARRARWLLPRLRPGVVAAQVLLHGTRACTAAELPKYPDSHEMDMKHQKRDRRDAPAAANGPDAKRQRVAPPAQATHAQCAASAVGAGAWPRPRPLTALECSADTWLHTPVHQPCTTLLQHHHRLRQGWLLQTVSGAACSTRPARLHGQAAPRDDGPPLRAARAWAGQGPRPSPCPAAATGPITARAGLRRRQPRRRAPPSRAPGGVTTARQWLSIRDLRWERRCLAGVRRAHPAHAPEPRACTNPAVQARAG